MAKKFKMMKVFDCQKMPDEVQEVIFEEFSGTSNDVFVEWNLDDYDIDDMLTDWLCKNGAEKHERVIIKYWW